MSIAKDAEKRKGRGRTACQGILFLVLLAFLSAAASSAEGCAQASPVQPNKGSASCRGGGALGQQDSSAVRPDASPANTPVTLVVRDVPGDLAIRTIFSHRDVAVRIHPSIYRAITSARVTLAIRSEPLWQALDRILSFVKSEHGAPWAMWDVEHRTYLIVPPLWRTPAPNVPAKTVSVVAHDADLFRTLRSLLTSANADYAIDRAVTEGLRISASVDRMPIVDALRLLLHAAKRDDLSAGARDGVFCIGRAQTGRFEPESPPEPHFTVRLRNIDIGTALNAIFFLMGRSMTRDQYVVGPVSVRFDDLPAPDALRSVLTHARCPLGVTYEVRDGVYNFLQAPDLTGWK